MARRIGFAAKVSTKECAREEPSGRRPSPAARAPLARLLQPDAAARVLHAERQVSMKARVVEVFEEGVAEVDAEGVVVLEEGAQKVGLVPRAPLHLPVLRVDERVEDVVQVDDHAALESRE